MNPADKLTQAGFVLTAENGLLWVEPAERLTAEWELFIRTNKPAIMASLTQASMPTVATRSSQETLSAVAATTTTPAPRWEPWPFDRREPTPGDSRWMSHKVACPVCLMAWKQPDRCPDGQRLFASLAPQNLTEKRP